MANIVPKHFVFYFPIIHYMLIDISYHLTFKESSNSIENEGSRNASQMVLPTHTHTVYLNGLII